MKTMLTFTSTKLSWPTFPKDPKYEKNLIVCVSMYVQAGVHVPLCASGGQKMTLGGSNSPFTLLGQGVYFLLFSSLYSADGIMWFSMCIRHSLGVVVIR